MKTFSNVSSAILFENKTGKNNLAIYFNDMGFNTTQISVLKETRLYDHKISKFKKSAINGLSLDERFENLKSAIDIYNNQTGDWLVSHYLTGKTDTFVCDIAVMLSGKNKSYIVILYGMDESGSIHFSHYNADIASDCKNGKMYKLKVDWQPVNDEVKPKTKAPEPEAAPILYSEIKDQIEDYTKQLILKGDDEKLTFLRDHFQHALHVVKHNKSKPNNKQAVINTFSW